MVILSGATALAAASCSSSTNNETYGGGPLDNTCSLGGNKCTYRCSSSLGCVDCVEDTDCGAAAPRCVLGQCQECATGADCSTGHTCFPQTHQCEVECTAPADCGNPDPFCDTATGACLGCRTGAALPFCHGDTCVQCEHNGDCTNAATPHCDNQHQCVAQ